MSGVLLGGRPSAAVERWRQANVACSMHFIVAHLVTYGRNGRGQRTSSPNHLGCNTYEGTAVHPSLPCSQAPSHRPSRTLTPPVGALGWLSERQRAPSSVVWAG